MKFKTYQNISLTVIAVILLSCSKEKKVTEIVPVPDELNEVFASAPLDGTGWVNKVYAFSIHRTWNVPEGDRLVLPLSKAVKNIFY